MEKVIQKLKGRELEFSAFLAEVVSGLDPTTWVSFIEGDEKFNQMSLEEAKKFIKQLNALLSDTYTILHAWNKNHSCYKVHESGRERSIDIYKELCNCRVILDRFDLLDGEK